MSTAFPITIYHNPKCGTSGNVLALIRSAGYEPEVVEYLKAGWTKPQLKTLLETMGVSAQHILRAKGTPAEELGLTAPGVAEETILDAMVLHPVLVNRPIVVTPRGARLCRPQEEVLQLLEKQPASQLQTEGKACLIPQAR
ncbi:MAG: arsenate reductase (glutaredoxin) [Proteobacteria bacterium]|nr:arsenate reductase (glutaredoxin) [Pseudomonadota bacterium]